MQNNICSLWDNKPALSREEFDAGGMTTVHGVCEWRVLINVSRTGLNPQLQQNLYALVFTRRRGPVKRGPDRNTQHHAVENKQDWRSWCYILQMTS